MTVPTGIAAIDQILEQRKFTNAEEAEAMAAQLLSVWRILRPTPDVDGTGRLGRTQSKEK